MSEESLWLDGNAVAGVLAELFASEMTSARRRCQSCHTVSVVGSHRVYQGAGLVLRCPACGDFAMTIVSRPDGHVVRLAGTWTVEISR